MRISDWSSDVCSSDLSGRRRSRRGRDQADALSRRRSIARHSRADRGGRGGQVGDRGGRTEGPLRRGAESPLGEPTGTRRSEEHTSELQSLMRISYAIFCLKKQTYYNTKQKQSS